VDTSTLKVVKTLPALQNTRLVAEIDWTTAQRALPARASAWVADWLVLQL